VADILYGMPAFSRQLEKDLEAGRLTLGGCCVTDDDPQWQCADCETELYRIRTRTQGKKDKKDKIK
jgi:hypothetical protein